MTPEVREFARLAELLREHDLRDYRQDRTDRGNYAPPRTSYTGRAYTGRAKRLAALLWEAGYRRCA